MGFLVVLIILLIIFWFWKKYSESFESHGHHAAWLVSMGESTSPVDSSSVRKTDAKGLSTYDYFYENISWEQNHELSENAIHSQSLKRDWNLPINKIQEIQKQL